MNLVLARRQGDDHDPFLEEFLDIVCRGLAPNVARLGFTIMDATRLLGQPLADVIGVACHVSQQLQHGSNGFRCHRCCGARRGGHGGGGGSLEALRDRLILGALTRLHIGGTGQATDLHARAHRATHELAGALILKGVRRGEPTFETMFLVAAEVEDDHDGLERDGLAPVDGWVRSSDPTDRKWCPVGSSITQGLRMLGSAWGVLTSSQRSMLLQKKQKGDVPMVLAHRSRILPQRRDCMNRPPLGKARERCPSSIAPHPDSESPRVS